jgi:hypothetical protein
MEGKPIPKGKGPFRMIVSDERRPAISILEKEIVRAIKKSKKSKDIRHY